MPDKLRLRFEAVAEALILADPAEPSSLGDVRTAARALSRAASRGGSPCAEEARGFSRAADEIVALEPDAVVPALEDLGRRYGALHALLGDGGATGRAAHAGTRPVPSAEPEGRGTSLAEDEDLMRDFVVRALEHLEAADNALLLLERDPSDAESLNAAFRAFHTVKGMAGFLGLADIERLSHSAEGILDGPRKGDGPLDVSELDSLFQSVDAVRAEVSRVSAASGSPAAVEGAPSSEATAAAGGAAGSAAEGAGRAAVRVDEERLDRLLDTIGELVIAEAMFSEAVRAGRSFSAYSQQLVRVDKITRELQEMATSLRMVPLRSTFSRMARLVRDTARKAGKNVEFVTAGEETELDKLVVDRIADPLIHLLRNAVDHGIEAADERVAGGKPESGTVGINAYHAGGGIHIEVTDDGRGFDAAAIVAAAREGGLLAEDEAPEGDALDLVFAPGLSTAVRVTDVSGRGVGMDVVRKTVEALRGQVEVHTDPGRGSRISIRLPLTLAIIDGIVVRVGSERYIIPTLAIERSVRPRADQLASVVGRGEVLQVDGALVPLVHLHDLFGVHGAQKDPTGGIVVIVGQNGERAGLVACEILGQQQIVIKSLGDAVRHTQGIAGGAIMPDGRVGLIVDVGGLVRLARHEGGVRE